MKKLFWYTYTRLRLWYLYRGGEIPWDERPETYKCPICYWNALDDDFYSKNYYGSDGHTYGYEGSHSWTEHWKCPRCGTKFEFDESD